MVRKIAIVSLSSGVIGEDFVQHEVRIGLKRLADYGITVQMMPHARKGIDYVKNHPEDRAADLLEAFRDDSVDMILCAIGGDDTYRLLPYLFEGDELKNALQRKIFLGFSDSTMNHLMLHKLGLPTFYGQSFLSDICEMDREMLPYTRHCFEELISTGTIREVRPSELWYEERTDWSEKAVGTAKKSHPNDGFRLLQGAPVFRGKILGGCIDTLFDLFDGTRYADSPALCGKYHLFPELSDWQGRILLLETSEERPTAEHYREMLLALKKTGIFDMVSGILCGKPIDGYLQAEYEQILPEVVGRPELPIVTNLSIGHATPRCILPFGIEAEVSVPEQKITFSKP